MSSIPGTLPLLVTLLLGAPVPRGPRLWASAWGAQTPATLYHNVIELLLGENGRRAGRARWSGWRWH